MTQDITSLIEKLEGAEVGSRELDALIWCVFRPEKIKMHGFHEPYGEVRGRTQVSFTLPPNRKRIVTNDRTEYPHAEPVTTSLDAALALAERLELSVGEILNDALEGPAGVGIWQSGWNGTISTIPQIARFVCIAILRTQSEAH